jgi:hypothetical protein
MAVAADLEKAARADVLAQAQALLPELELELQRAVAVIEKELLA